MWNIFFKKPSIKRQDGAAMLMLVIILTAAALIVASSVLFLGLGELDMGYTYQCGEEAFAAVDGCMEETLRRLKLEPGYIGGNLDLSNGSCIIEVSGDATSKIINATSTTGNCNKKIESHVSISNGVITINSWREK